MNNKLTLPDIAALLAVRTGRDKRSAEQFLRELISVVTDGLFTDKIVKIKGIGTFKIVPVEQRESVHVNTGERFIIPAHYKYSFLPDKELRDTVNAPFSFFETTEIGNDVDFSDLEESNEADLTGEEDESVEEVIPEEEIPAGSRVEGVLSEALKELQEEPAFEPEPIEEAEKAKAEETEASFPVVPVPLPEEEEIPVPIVTEEELPLPEKEQEKPVEAPISVTPPSEKPEPESIYPEPGIMGNFEPVYTPPFYKKDSFLAVLILLAFIGVSALLYIWYKNRSIELVQVKTIPPVAVIDSMKESSFQLPDTLVADISSGEEEPVIIETPPAEEQDLSILEKQPEKKQPEPAKQPAQWVDKVTIASGDRLTLISLKYYGHKFFWVYIYEANKDVIKDPNNIPIGTVLKVPAPGIYGINSKSKASISKAAALQTKILQGKE